MCVGYFRVNSLFTSRVREEKTMLRMAHRILSQPLLILRKPEQMPGGKSSELHPRVEAALKERIQSAEIVMADNVAEYLSTDPDKKWSESDFPYLVPPFETTFVEYNTDDSYMSQIGVLFWTHSDTTTFDKTVWGPDVRWVVTAFMFASLEGQAAIFDGQMNMGVRIDGTMSGMYDKAGLWGSAILPAFLAVSFMHCKKVVRRQDFIAGPGEKWTRRTGTPKLKYHVLDINPMKEVLVTEGGSQSVGTKKALHICRGHFATYTAEKPLFGNIVGTVWKPAHVRGDIKQGAVVKDYAVSPATP